MNLLLIILPVFIIFAVGYIGNKILKFDVKSISTVALYLMSPFLAFRTFYTTELTLDYFYLLIAGILLFVVLLAISLTSARLLKVNQSQQSAIILSSVYMNSGNYGAPVILFAFGAAGFDYAVIIMIFQSLLMNTTGIFFASLGGEQKTNIKLALQSALKMPILYSSLIGFILNYYQLKLPTAIFNGISLIADAAIPTIMLVLGMQLSIISRKKVTYKFVAISSFIRIIVSPIVAIIIMKFMPITDLAKTVFIIQMAMPSAANTTILSLRYNTEPDLVSFITLCTTIISIISIPILMYFLNV